MYGRDSGLGLGLVASQVPTLKPNLSTPRRYPTLDLFVFHSPRWSLFLHALGMESIIPTLAQLLADTQRREEGPRKKAEADLKLAQTNPDYPRALAAIASGSFHDIKVRQSALTVLRGFIERNWSEDDDEEDDQPRVPIADATKAELRDQMLELATRDEVDRLVKASARYGNLTCNPTAAR